MKNLMTSISKLKEIVEEVALSANLAPYPVEPVGVVTCSKKKKKDKDEKKS